MTKFMCVILVYFLTLHMSIFEKFLLDDIPLTLFVNKTSHDKGANEKRKRCNRIPSDITLGRNYTTAG